MHSVDLRIRADHAFERGVDFPSAWADLTAPPPEAPSKLRFTKTAASEVAKDAAQKGSTDGCM